MPDLAPTRFGKYRIISELGRGGMATVYLAAANAGPASVRKLVVLKLLSERLGSDKEFVGMFAREARIAAELSHPNVVQTYTVGKEGDQYYILMEYLEGVPLSAIMQHSADWSLRDRLPLFGGLCFALTGLAYVHDFRDHEGKHPRLVHRDIKPDNIFITTSGEVKLLDFGVAKGKSPEFEATMGAAVRGTVQYLAPESVQADRELDHRGDLFGAGVVLAELATGRRYWGDQEYTQILARLGKGDLPSLPDDLNEEVPPALMRTITRSLEPDPDDRFVSALEMRRAILKFLAKQGYRLDASDLAAVVRHLFEPIKQQRADLIGGALAEIEEASGVYSLPLPTPTGTMQSQPDATQPAAGAAMQSTPPNPVVDPPQEEEKRGSAWRYAPLALLLLAPVAWFMLPGSAEPAEGDVVPASFVDPSAAGERSPAPAGEPAEDPPEEPPIPASAKTPPPPPPSERAREVDEGVADGEPAAAEAEDAAPGASAPDRRRSRSRRSKPRRGASDAPAPGSAPSADAAPAPPRPEPATSPKPTAKPKKVQIEANPYAR